MIQKISIFFSCIFFFSLLSAQSAGDYQRVINKGTLPSEVFTPSTVKFQEQIQEIDADATKTEQRIQQQYYLESGFTIDDMMRSGAVLYNPEYNEYLEDVADVLLKGNAELRSKIHFYLLRSPVVNAFAGAGGNIFISMGLIAMLDNEAELAYIMGHEIGHIAKEHGLDFYMEAVEIDKKSTNNSLLKKSSFDNTMLTKNRYSQKLETEADDYGIQTLIKTNYFADSLTLNDVFDVLKYSYLPYENVSFPIEYFEGSNYVVSKNFKLDSVKRISGEPETARAKEANKSTHPSIGDRRENVRNFMKGINTDGRYADIVSEEKFTRLRDIARYELPMFYLHNEFFQDAIYSSFIILQKDTSHNKYLEKIIAKSLTGLSKFRNSKEDEVYAEKARFETYEGQQQQLYFMLWAMNDVELNVMALDYTFGLHLKYPDDKEIMPLCEALVNDLVFYHFNDAHDFYETETIPRDSLYELAAIANPKIKVVINEKSTRKTRKTTTAKNKRASTEKIRADKSKKHLLYAYYDYWENKEFRKLWNDAVTERDEREANIKELKKAGVKYTNKGDTRDYFYGEKMGIERVVVVNPFYKRIDLRKGGIEYISSEEGEFNYMEILKANADLLKMDIEIIDPLKLEAYDAEKFNDMNELNDWFSEQLDFGNINMPGYNQAVVDSLAGKYNTDYFLWTGILSLRDKQNVLGPIIYIALSPLFIPLLPYGIYELVAPEYEFFYLSLLYNVKTHEASVLKFLFLENNDTRAILNSHTYEMLYEISTKPKLQQNN
ncbi:MAG: M48 family metallopeptidase [Chitinophagales bacterium]